MIVDTFGLAFLDLGVAIVAATLLAGVMASYGGLGDGRIETLLRAATMGVAMMLIGGLLLLSGIRP